jgi:hypothetical protein
MHYPLQVKAPDEPHPLAYELAVTGPEVPKATTAEIFLRVSLLSQLGQHGI